MSGHRNCSVHGTVQTGADGVCPLCLASSQWNQNMNSILPNAMKSLIDGATPTEQPPASASQPLLGDGNWVTKTASMWTVAAISLGFVVAFAIAYGITAMVASFGCAWYSYIMAYLWAVPSSLVLFAAANVWWYRVYQMGMIPTLQEEYSMTCLSVTVTYWEREDSGFRGFFKSVARHSSRPGDGCEPCRCITCHVIWGLLLCGILSVPVTSCLGYVSTQNISNIMADVMVRASSSS